MTTAITTSPNVAYICADAGIPVFGHKGASIHVQEVIRALRHQGATVDLFTVNRGGKPPADLADVTVHDLPSIPKGDRARREQIALCINENLAVELARHGPYDLVYERYSLWSYSAMEWAQEMSIPALLEVNAPLIEEQVQYRGLVHRDEAQQVATRVFQAASGLIAVSDAIQQYLSGWVAPEKIHVIPNGVNEQRFSQSPAAESLAADPMQTIQPQSSDHFTVGFVGSLKPWHGLSHLVNAFTHIHQQIPQAHLLIVGDGPERPDIEAALIGRGLESVTHFTGAVPPDHIPLLLATMDVAVAPYPAHTHFYFSPLKVVEYMAAGLPVVASQIGQLNMLIADGQTGLLCPPGDEEALTAALIRLWKFPSLRQQLGWAARQYILAHHTWDRVAQKILALAQQETTTPALV